MSLLKVMPLFDKIASIHAVYTYSNEFTLIFKHLTIVYLNNVIS